MPMSLTNVCLVSVLSLAHEALRMVEMMGWAMVMGNRLSLAAELGDFTYGCHGVAERRWDRIL